METFNTQAKALISKKNSKNLFNTLRWIQMGGNPNNIGYELAKMIVENSNDFTKDIAEKFVAQYEKTELIETMPNGDIAECYSLLSEKQTWCMVYQLINNENVYKL